jgi:hypothetical protein
MAARKKITITLYEREMINMLKKLGITLLVLIIFSLSGCGMVIKQLDSSWVDNNTVYQQPDPLPPLAIPSELITHSSD